MSSGSHAGLLGPAGHLRFEKTGGLLLAVLVSVPVAWLIVRGWGLVAAGGFALAVFYFIILARWERGIYGLLVYLPFSGLVTLALYPWKGPAGLNPVLYKDWLFVLPAYIGFFGALFLQRIPRPPVERLAVGLLLLLTLLVVVQMANPGVASALVALIGAKVWLFYLPLYVLSAALVPTRHKLAVLLRLLVVLAVIPCAVGIAENLVSRVFGYQRVMADIYGAAAFDATQQFTSYEVGSGWIERIPSTFTFVSQYFSFTLAMLVPCYAMGRTDPSVSWRRAGKWTLLLVTVAGVLSGARAAFVFVPLLLALMYGLDRGFRGLVRAGLYIGGAAAAGLAVSRTTVVVLYQLISELFGAYAENTAYGGLAQAITASPMGSGTGTNTGAARYALYRPELFSAIENYYAKASYELGIVGLLLVWALFAALIWQGWKAQRRMADPGLRPCGAALVAFLMALALYSFKGMFIDMDPINVYFWMFAGLLAGLPTLDATLTLRYRQAQEEARRHTIVTESALS